MQAGERVIDMDAAISALNPDTSQFATMLTKISSASSEGASLGVHRDLRLWHDGRWIEK